MNEFAEALAAAKKEFANVEVGRFSGYRYIMVESEHGWFKFWDEEPYINDYAD